MLKLIGPKHEYKKCTKCLEIKEFKDFTIHKGYMNSSCRACAYAYVSQYKRSKRAQNHKIKVKTSTKESKKKYYKANPHKRLEERRRHYNRKKNDPVWRIRKNLRKRLKEQLSKGTKIGPYVEMIGCTAHQLRTHLEAQFKAGMTWENYGIVWHVDHIRPLSSFDVTDKSQRLAANNYRNLQPLFAEDNIAKGDKWDNDG